MDVSYMLPLFHTVQAAGFTGNEGGGGAIVPINMVNVEWATEHKTCCRKAVSGLYFGIIRVNNLENTPPDA